MIAAALILLALSAEDPDCSGTTLQMVRCASRVFDGAATELDRAWSGIVRALGEEDRRFADPLSPTRVEAARAAQEAWLRYRDAQCTAEADNEARGGSVYPLHYISCRTRMTRERVQQLRDRYLAGGSNPEGKVP